MLFWRLELIEDFERLERVDYLDRKNPLGIEPEHHGLLIVGEIPQLVGLVNHPLGGDRINLAG